MVTISPNYRRYVDLGSSHGGLGLAIIFGQKPLLNMKKNIFGATSANALSNSLVYVKFGSAVNFLANSFAYCENLSIDLTKFDNNVAIDAGGIKYPSSRLKIPTDSIFYKSGISANTLSRNIIISDAVSQIKGSAFAQSGYTHIIIERGGHTNGNYIINLTNSFSGMNLQKILVPQEMLNYYQTATNWSQYASIMVGY